MRYMGSKRRIAKHILPIILEDRKPGQVYVEPFCGGCNTLRLVKGPRIGADSHFYLMAFWKAFQSGWWPPEKITEEEYYRIRSNKDEYPPELVGYVGFNLCFGSRFLAGWARGLNHKGHSRDYHDESLRALKKHVDQLVTPEVTFIHSDYQDLEIPEHSLIYCDPPYKGARKYIGTLFDHDEFFAWCREKRSEGHTLFVSEKSAPSDFECVWSQDLLINFANNNTRITTQVEKLFTLR